MRRSSTHALLPAVAIAIAACGSPDALTEVDAGVAPAIAPSPPDAARPIPAPGTPGASDSGAADAGAGDAGARGDSAAAADAQADATPVVNLPACNGAHELCARRFDQVAYPTTHNAMSSGEDNFIAPNQNRNMTKQLDAGMRGLMLDTYSFLGGTYLCHGSCAIGSKPLAGGLGEIKTFLVSHPREVVSIIFESYISAADTRTAFVSAGLEPLLHAQPAGAPWPTLEAMIASGKRLVVFTDSGGGAYPWYHAVWDYAWETPYSYKTAGDMQCVKNRGNQANALFIFNHFLTNPVAAETLARQVNFNPFFQQRATECQTTFGRLPNFVTVDFEDVGDVVAVVRALNGLP